MMFETALSIEAGLSANPAFGGFTALRPDRLDDRVRAYRAGDDPDLDLLVADLVARAGQALDRGPHSVIHKTETPPSGDKRDYLHPAPYYWPNPDTPDGLPHIRQDGRRVPGTVLYGAQHERYDRTRLQRLFDDSFVLCLAWFFAPHDAYLGHAARMLETFFVDPATAMRPHLRYAQIRHGHNGDVGVASGLIEFKDVFYYLDAVRVLAATGALENRTLDAFNDWLARYLEWLLGSEQGRGECQSLNNHGVYFDLQVAAIAAFLRWNDVLEDTFDRAKLRLAMHFTPDGEQPRELARTETAHYCCFNLQGWIDLAELSGRYGEDLWMYWAPSGANLAVAADWLLARAGRSWGFRQTQPFEAERILPIWEAAEERLDPAPERPIGLPRLLRAKPMMSQGIRPFWQI